MIEACTPGRAVAIVCLNGYSVRRIRVIFVPWASIEMHSIVSRRLQLPLLLLCNIILCIECKETLGSLTAEQQESKTLAAHWGLNASLSFLTVAGKCNPKAKILYLIPQNTTFPSELAIAFLSI